MLDKAMAWFEHQCNQNKLIRRVLLVWLCGLATMATIIVFTNPPGMSGGDAAALGTIWTALSVPVGLYFKGRGDSERS